MGVSCYGDEYRKKVSIYCACCGEVTNRDRDSFCLCDRDNKKIGKRNDIIDSILDEKWWKFWK